MENNGYWKIIAIFLIVVAIFGVINYSHTETTTVVVSKIDMQQHISNDGNGNVSTEYKCVVYTDKGAYEIQQQGFWYANPTLIGQLKEGDTITVTSRGFEILPLGEYRKIVEINK